MEKLGESEPVRLRLGQRVPLSMVNETMMEHRMHLHGFFARLQNGHPIAGPLKHTFIVRPAETVVAEFTADAAGPRVFHCRLFYRHGGHGHGVPGRGRGLDRRRRPPGCGGGSRANRQAAGPNLPRREAEVGGSGTESSRGIVVRCSPPPAPTSKSGLARG